MLSREQRVKMPAEWHAHVKAKSAAVLEWAALGLSSAEIAARLKAAGLDRPPCPLPERPWPGPRPPRPTIKIEPIPLYRPAPPRSDAQDFFSKYLGS